MLKNLELSDKDHIELITYCKIKKLSFFQQHLMLMVFLI